MPACLEQYFDQDWILRKAEFSWRQKPVHLTDVIAPLSEGGPNDYYSNGDYWWPNPQTADGLPYIRRDGLTNPDNFDHHRRLLRTMRTNVANLAAGYLITRDEKYAEKAVTFLREFFLGPQTRMNPHLRYAQAIPGRCSGRGIGIIDTLHLIDLPFAVAALDGSEFLTSRILNGLKAWFAAYLEWICTHPYGVSEMNAKNNHGVCWCVQAAVFALFTQNQRVLDFCRERYKTLILPEQMAPDGSLPRELNRTKPYSYSIFTLDNLVTLCQVLSTDEDNLWSFQLPDGRGIQKGIEFLYPFLADKARWPYPPDVQSFEEWPVQISCLLFAGRALGEEKYLRLWKRLNPDPVDPEVRRNIAIRQPILWLADRNSGRYYKEQLTRG